MVAELTELDKFFITGISVRTTNQDGKSQSDIGELWSRFMQEGLIDKIENKSTNNLYCIYTDYENNFEGAYTTILGCRVNSLENVPPGFVNKTIPAAKYLLYKSTSKIPDCVVETWRQIWQSDKSRAYTADFDVYGKEATDPENAVVYTYVSVD